MKVYLNIELYTELDNNFCLDKLINDGIERIFREISNQDLSELIKGKKFILTQVDKNTLSNRGGDDVKISLTELVRVKIR